MANKKSSDSGQPADDKKSGSEKRRSALTVILLILLLLIILLLLFYAGGKLLGKGGSSSQAGAGDAGVDTLQKGVDTSVIGTAVLVDSASVDTARKAKPPVRTKRAVLVGVDTSLANVDTSASIDTSLASAALIDTLAADTALIDTALVDTMALVVDSALLRAAACARDTVVPWVYADPSGGLHRQAVSVKLVANKVCKVEWSYDGVAGWKVYDGKSISVSVPTTIYYRASDSCGKKMDVRSKRYEFEVAGSRCPSNMELVKSMGREFCVDVYQWPNRRGVVPQAYVSLYQAMDSCFSVRKRLCTSEEWTSACAGPEKWKYTYGENYEWNTCATRDTMAQKSGGKPECRSYYGAFDMSGNLAEWSSTPAPQDRSFNNVMGGFWASGNQSRCADARYSYYPQNRHNPVGFRCCADAPPEARPKGSR